MSYFNTEFKLAKPIWEKNTETEMNRTLIFRTEFFGAEDAVLRLTGASVYRVFVNQELAYWGPARSAKNFFRVDEIHLGKYLSEEQNTIEVEVSGYYCNNYDWIRHTSFLCAEVIRGEKILAATGEHGWKVFLNRQKVQKVARYSFQRTFTEVYDYRQEKYEPVEWEFAFGGKWIQRDLPNPSMIPESVQGGTQIGNLMWVEDAPICKHAFLTRAGKKFDGFLEEELEVNHVADVMHYFKKDIEKKDVSLPFALSESTFATLRMAGNRTGLVHICVEATGDCDLYVTFDEILTDGQVDYLRAGCGSVLLFRLRGGERYELLTAEPYTLQYMDLFAVGGGVKIEEAGMIRIDLDPSEILLNPHFSPKDEKTEKIWNAAVETFRQNTLDIFMDCPSRERAGWLCDSFFTSRVERLLTKKNRVERNFLSNFVSAEEFEPLPEGMIPMCYPSDHPNGNFIPNWAMWFIVELKEYLERTGDKEFISEAKKTVYGILGYLHKFENSDGLLEHLDGWVFVEWSKCNDFIQDINYPSNMMYYLAKATVAELYGDTVLKEEAKQLRETIRQKSRMEMFYCDNSVYRDGVAVLSGECTESAQYYAFFTGVATREEDAELWETLVRDFGPERKETGLWKEIWPSNAFIGNYLRLELLDRAGESEKLKENILGYFGYMAEQTGTLWENDTPSASCNHGFASHVLVWLSHLGYGKD